METRSNKLQPKDLINVGIFTAIYFIIFFAGMMLGYIPIFIPLLGLVCSILCGIPFMLYLTKVKKFGMVSLTGIILGLLNLIMGSGVLVLIFDYKLPVFPAYLLCRQHSYSHRREHGRGFSSADVPSSGQNRASHLQNRVPPPPSAGRRRGRGLGADFHPLPQGQRGGQWRF